MRIIIENGLEETVYVTVFSGPALLDGDAEEGDPAMIFFLGDHEQWSEDPGHKMIDSQMLARGETLECDCEEGLWTQFGYSEVLKDIDVRESFDAETRVARYLIVRTEGDTDDGPRTVQ